MKWRRSTPSFLRTSPVVSWIELISHDLSSSYGSLTLKMMYCFLVGLNSSPNSSQRSYYFCWNSIFLAYRVILLRISYCESRK